MTNILEKVKEDLQVGVRLRESGKLKESRKIFISLLRDLESYNQKSEVDFKNLYIDAMGEWIIQLRHEAKNSYMEALKEAFKVYNYSKSNKIDNYKSVRGVSNTLMNMENYENAERYLKELLALTPKEDSAKTGDALAHLARCHFRQGFLKKASEEINLALKKIDTNTFKCSDLEIAAWKSHALMVKALILKSQKNTPKSLSLVKEALEISKKNKLNMRIEEAAHLLMYLQSELKEDG